TPSAVRLFRPCPMICAVISSSRLAWRRAIPRGGRGVSSRSQAQTQQKLAQKRPLMAARPASPQRSLDSFDRAVQRDARTPQRAIAEAVNLSAAAVQRRIAAMEASGVIRRNVALVDPKSIPLTITSIVEVYLQDER